ncbi:MAG: entericidin A/B family lipoprotein [Burkholderiales bacterium]|jgi:predicted small secreted protein|nr:entericidin A/B family lipoprotein [Burkholderiales bacterium]
MLMKRVIMLMVAMLVLAGCNTVAGVGKDVERAGEAIQRSTK